MFDKLRMGRRQEAADERRRDLATRVRIDEMTDSLTESVSMAESIQEELSIEPEVEAAVEEPVKQQTEEPVVYPTRVSDRMSKHAALARLTGDLDGQVRSLSEQLEQSKRMLKGLVQHVTDAEVETRRTDALDADRQSLSDQLDKLRRQHDRLSAALTGKTTELAASAARIVQLESEIEEQSFRATEAREANDGLKADLARIGNELDHLRAELGRSVESYDELRIQHASSERARIEMSERLDRVQESETQNRNKAIELELKNESIGQQLPKLVQENESLRAQLEASERERASVTTQIAALKDRSQQALRELEDLRRQSASEAYSAKTELEVSLAARRVAERAQAEAEYRASEKEAKLQETESARRSMAAELNDARRQAIAAKYEESVAFGKLSELNVRYTSDLMVLDQLREQVKQLQANLDLVTAENQRLLRTDAPSKVSDTQSTRTRDVLVAVEQETPAPTPAPSTRSQTNVTSLPSFDTADISVANDRRVRKDGVVFSSAN